MGMGMQAQCVPEYLHKRSGTRNTAHCQLHKYAVMNPAFASDVCTWTVYYRKEGIEADKLSWIDAGDRQEPLSAEIQLHVSPNNMGS